MLLDIFINVLCTSINNGLSILKENHKTNKFFVQLQEDIFNFEQRHKGTLIVTDRFYECIKNYNIIEKIFKYVNEPQKNNLPEAEFIVLIKNEIVNALKDELVIVPSDEKLILSFIEMIINKIKEYFDSMTLPQDKGQRYDIKQVEKKLDLFIEIWNSKEKHYESVLREKSIHEDERIPFFEKAKDIQQLLEEAIELVVKCTKTDYNQIVLFSRIDLYNTSLIVFADNVPDHKQRYRVVAINGLISEAYYKNIVIRLNDITKSEKYFVAVSETKSELVIPIRGNDFVFGVINSESENINYYSSEMVEELCVISEDLGTALERMNYRLDIPYGELPYVHI